MHFHVVVVLPIKPIVFLTFSLLSASLNLKLPNIRDRRAEQNAFLFILKHAVYVLVLAIWFRYDLSPITVKYVERRKPLYHFITTVWSNHCFTVIFTKDLHHLF